MDDNSLRLHQLTMLTMLKDFDAVCKKYDIHYTLFSGTALGAVRHGGFIPWDDDLDIIMPRSEYERFFEVASSDFDKDKYYLQREFSPHWPMFFSKLRLNNSTCIEKYRVKDRKMHQGVYIDIFPCDNLSDNLLMRKMQFFASKIVIAKSLYKRGYLTDDIRKKCFMVLCRMLPLKPFWKMCVLKKNVNTRMVHSFLGGSSDYGKSIYERHWMTETVDIMFEDGKFPISAHYDDLLSRLYGDYNVLPSPKERVCKVHAAILDLNRPYTEYLEMQKDMPVEVYSKSIR